MDVTVWHHAHTTSHTTAQSSGTIIGAQGRWFTPIQTLPNPAGFEPRCLSV